MVRWIVISIGCLACAVLSGWLLFGRPEAMEPASVHAVFLASTLATLCSALIAVVRLAGLGQSDGFEAGLATPGLPVDGSGLGVQKGAALDRALLERVSLCWAQRGGSGRGYQGLAATGPGRTDGGPGSFARAGFERASVEREGGKRVVPERSETGTRRCSNEGPYS